jgi:hypothetical protein
VSRHSWLASLDLLRDTLTIRRLERPMGCAFSAEEKDGFYRVLVTGDNTPENVRRYLREVYDLCARTGASSVLIEENLSGPRLPPADVYRIILSASSDTLPVILRIAYVDVKAERETSNVDLGVAVAHDRGVNVEAFSSVAEAEAWLRQQIHASSS